MVWKFGFITALVCLIFQSEIAKSDSDILLHTNFPPLLLAGGPPEGAHPLGGPALRFVRLANGGLAASGRQIRYHVMGSVPATDTGTVHPSALQGGDFATVYDAVAAGRSGGGTDMAIGISNQNGLSFGELHVAALPFGMEADEFAAYLYDGGGLALQQELYDKHFNRQLIVLPAALTPTQGGGWFPEPLPDPDRTENLSPPDAMRALCRKPWIVRWPEPGAGIWSHACADQGVETGSIGPKTRCGDPVKICPSDGNPETVTTDRLTFGGFVPGIPPHIFIQTGNVDAYELNLPSTEVQMIKLATSQGDLSSTQGELSTVINRAPYLYGQTWHQPLTYLELLINRNFWESLSDTERWAIESAAESATFRSLTSSLSRQGKGLEELEQNGATVLRWPKGLIELLRAASDTYLDDKALRLEAAGDPDYREVLDHMRSFHRSQSVYFDFGDLNQGRAALKTSP